MRVCVRETDRQRETDRERERERENVFVRVCRCACVRTSANAIRILSKLKQNLDSFLFEKIKSTGGKKCVCNFENLGQAYPARINHLKRVSLTR